MATFIRLLLAADSLQLHCLASRKTRPESHKAAYVIVSLWLSAGKKRNFEMSDSGGGEQSLAWRSGGHGRCGLQGSIIAVMLNVECRVFCGRGPRAGVRTGTGCCRGLARAPRNERESCRDSGVGLWAVLRPRRSGGRTRGSRSSASFSPTTASRGGTLAVLSLLKLCRSSRVLCCGASVAQV